ncbi:MAG: glycosyltransferase family 39 protein [Candidatus Sungbacteria bacterium]|nr:glycosyltransferase family 39 protein [Candidatus Sungbacteria bacterium]
MEFSLADRLALLILAAMAGLMFFSARGESAIMDELAHIPAGYSYLTQKDYRLNPEHPPLLKDLAAFPALFLNLHFPLDTKPWTNDINGQWDQGRIFLYESGNNADQILFWMRLPVMALAVLFGWIFWRWTKNRFGAKAGLFALVFYSFSPTFIAHSRYITTDLAAAFAFFIGIASFLNFLENPSWKKVTIAGIAFGVAQLLKFSLVLLIPLYGILLIVWALSQMHLQISNRIALFFRLLAKTAAIGAIGLLLIWIVYAYHVWNYPPELQFRDAEFILGSFGNRFLVDLDLWMIGQPLLRPLAQYLLGVLMVVQRVAGGNTAYFWGEVSSSGSFLYFPVLYLFKEPLAFHILSLAALGFALQRILRTTEKSASKMLWWIRDHFLETASWIFILFYWSWSMRSPLNIGIRHLLPTFPFLYALVAKEITPWLEHRMYSNPHTWYGALKNIYYRYVKSIPKHLFIGVLLIWLIGETITAFPHYLPYYNKLAGGSNTGYLVAVDSNYDWGQDLKRLKAFVEENNIEKMPLDYFGGGSPRYYLGDRFEPWWSARGPMSGWFAISSSFQMSAFGTPVKGFVRKPEDSYEWLKPFTPVAKAGKSIFIYRLP